MAIVGTLLDKARAKRGIPTDMALGERIGKSRQVISQWRAGSTWPEEDMVVKLAEMAGDEPAQWLVAIKAVRSDGAAAKVWASLAKRLGAVAAVLLVAALPFGAQAKAGSHFAINPDTAHYVTRLGYYWGVLRDWLAHRLHRPEPASGVLEARSCL